MTGDVSEKRCVLEFGLFPQPTSFQAVHWDSHSASHAAMPVPIEWRAELGDRAIVKVTSDRHGQSENPQVQSSLTPNSAVKKSCIKLLLLTPILQKVKLRYLQDLPS